MASTPSCNITIYFKAVMVSVGLIVALSKHSTIAAFLLEYEMGEKYYKQVNICIKQVDEGFEISREGGEKILLNVGEIDLVVEVAKELYGEN